MDRYSKGMIVVPLLFLLLLACSRPVDSIAPTAKPGSEPPPVGQKPTPAQDWQAISGEARKEGVVSIYTTWPGQTRVDLIPAFKQKYGIDLEFTTFGRGAELVAKAQAEKTANLYNVDVFGAGLTTLLITAKPAGLLGQIEPLLALPEAKDPKVWRGGVFPFLDKDRQAFALTGYPNRFITYNTTAVRQGEITTYRDVLKPQYKGKVTLNDPTISGAGIGFFAHLAYHIWNEQEAIDYIRQLIRNDTVVMRDQRLQAEWVARGRNAIALAPDPNTFAELLKAGAPIATVVTKEGVFFTYGDGSLAVPTVSPHPKATALFVNWLLTKEGQSIFYKGAAATSLRLDVPPEGLLPHLIPGPQEKLFPDSEDFAVKRGELFSRAKQILAEEIK